MKGIRLVPDDTKIPFMKFSRFGYFLSGILCAASLLLFYFNGLNMGVDFKGGTVITIRTEQAADLDQLRSTINGLGLGSAELQEFGSPNDVLIRIGTQEGGEGAQQAAVNKIKDALGPGVDYRSVEVVGPKVSGELIWTAILAVSASLVAILIYIWLRFEWQFSVGAVVALIHDVLLTIGIFALFQLRFDLATIAALLTIVGYSINDTVVIFDRLRENLIKFKKMPLRDVMNLSVNETLSRTIMTSGTTLVALIALLVLGGDVIRNFVFAIAWGIVVGTYSSVFVAKNIVLFLGTKRDWTKTEPAAGTQFGKTDA